MAHGVRAVVFLGAAGVAAGACVTVKHYTGADCTGEATTTTVPTLASKGSGCYSVGAYSIKDMYCDADSVYRQTVFQGNGCEGQGYNQVYDKCLYGYSATCTLEDCPEGTLKGMLGKSGGPTATWKQYANADCTGDVSEFSYQVRTAEGAPCFNMGKYSLKDNYCAADGTYRQKAFGPGQCEGPGMNQVFKPGECLSGYRFVSCNPATSMDSAAVALLAESFGAFEPGEVEGGEDVRASGVLVAGVGFAAGVSFASVVFWYRRRSSIHMSESLDRKSVV